MKKNYIEPSKGVKTRNQIIVYKFAELTKSDEQNKGLNVKYFSAVYSHYIHLEISCFMLMLTWFKAKKKFTTKN